MAAYLADQRMTPFLLPSARWSPAVRAGVQTDRRNVVSSEPKNGFNSVSSVSERDATSLDGDPFNLLRRPCVAVERTDPRDRAGAHCAERDLLLAVGRRPAIARLCSEHEDEQDLRIGRRRRLRDNGEDIAVGLVEIVQYDQHWIPRRPRGEAPGDADS